MDAILAVIMRQAFPFLAQASDLSSAFLNYGAMGLFAAMLLVAVRVLYTQSAKAIEQERANAQRLLEAERTEKHKLQDEIRALTNTMISQVVPALERSTLAIAEIAKSRGGIG